MSDLICVTNRGLCPGGLEDFLRRVEDIAQCAPAAVLLREKDLTPEAYQALAQQVLAICGRYGVRCILHSFADAAIRLGAEAIHLPMSRLRGMSEAQKAHFAVIGASCHSLEEAVQAQALGCTYLTAGHIFATGCKPGVSPRGLDFLRDVCAGVQIPVYAIGGIGYENIARVRRAGAAGACVMSGPMQCENVRDYLKRLE